MIPELVRTVVGNHTPRAMRKRLALVGFKKITRAMGIQAVEGMGPTILIKGMIQ
jgi:hypothetical protein